MSVFSLCLFLSTIICYVSLAVRISMANLLRNETDRLALLAFKSRITQDLNGVVYSWNESYHFCQWEGVTCGRRHQRVTTLNLNSKGLTGLLSPHLGNLSFLRELNLGNNSFSGEIPSEFGNLFRLETLFLFRNSLMGEIPVNITLCANLMELGLSNNNLVGNIPIEVGYFPKLSFLKLDNNNFSGSLPPSLGNLTSLETLSLFFNNIGGTVPNTLGQLKHLKYLLLSSNNFFGAVPPSIYNLSALEVISMPENHLSGSFPTEIGHMLPNIQYLLVGGNQFTGSIPRSLFNNSNLKQIDVGHNQFGGNIGFNIGNLKDLELLSLEKNNFGSGRPGDLDFFSSLVNCTKLQKVAFFSNQFGGALPTSIGNFSNDLVVLNLGENQLYGNIPFEVGNIRNLYALDLAFNHFTGGIPMSLTHLQKLEVLFLSNNQLSGNIRPFTKNMSNLSYLRLHKNNFEGSISFILDNQNVREMILFHNNFSGTIPMEVGTLKNLLAFHVSENKLSGEIPNTIAGSEMLVLLYLQNNFFQGPIPSSISSLKSLEVLDVSHNNISGLFPKDLGMLPSLQNLNLSFNNLEGEVPTEGLFRNASAFSVLGNEKTCGGIPELKLGKCHVGKSRKHQSHLDLKLILGISIPTFLVTMAIVIYLRKKPKEKHVSEEHPRDLIRVSFYDLFKATAGFSSSNLIGVGSYGTVYRGLLQVFRDPVAIKVFKVIEERQASKSFMSECETLREVRHRNLLKILTVCSSVDFNGIDFKALIFKYMPNGSLENWLHPISNGHLQGNLSLHQRLNIAIDVALALDYLHNQSTRPIVHCDLKSSNVLLGDDMTAHVGDFGLAKFLRKSGNTSQSNNSETESITLRGTIGYIPPEYGMAVDVTTKGDVYSYGILLLEMLTGKRPTDQMFKEAWSLRDYSKVALPHRVMDIIDTRMLSEAASSTTRIRECLSSIMHVGVSCSTESATERMDMNEILKAMHSIKDDFLHV